MRCTTNTGTRRSLRAMNTMNIMAQRGMLATLR